MREEEIFQCRAEPLGRCADGITVLAESVSGAVVGLGELGILEERADVLCGVDLCLGLVGYFRVRVGSVKGKYDLPDLGAVCTLREKGQSFQLFRPMPRRS